MIRRAWYFAALTVAWMLIVLAGSILATLTEMAMLGGKP